MTDGPTATAGRASPIADAIADLRFDHVGVQVGDLAAAIATLTRVFGYRQATQPVVNTRHQVEVVFLEKPNSTPIKLFRSIVAGAGEGGKPAGPTKLHHLAFHTSEIGAAVDALVALGARVLNAPAPGEAFDDEPIAFLFAGGLNIELVSTDKRRDRLNVEA